MKSHSIYVTNFPDSVSSHDLWRECNAYGTVVDVFIPSKKSQAGKRFAFVRFIKVFNLDRLVKNLCTIWIGRHHLFANQVQYERLQKPFSSSFNDKTTRPVNVPSSKPRQTNGFAGSFANVVNGGQPSVNSRSLTSPSPALVLDENCIINWDYSKFAMGRVKDANSIPNLLTLLSDEGFLNIKLKYLGGLWVMFEFVNVESKANLIAHTGVNSWFQVIQDFIPDFEDLSSLDDDSVQGEKHYVKLSFLCEEEEGEFNATEVEEVAETIFDDISSSPKQNNGNSNQKHSEDPFELYNLLSKKKNVVEACISSPSLSHPPGFTPMGFESEFNNVQDNGDINEAPYKILSPLADDKIINTSQVVQKDPLSGSSGHNIGTNGGSVLGVLEEVIWVGQAMGYSMEGCEKDVEAIIGNQGDDMVFR
nr:RNA-directed DNA polymerase, eukaryota, nucleotide-binding alpha-beta plait domain protein [Tanacetum cinerariifolium]